MPRSSWLKSPAWTTHTDSVLLESQGGSGRLPILPNWIARGIPTRRAQAGYHSSRRTIVGAAGVGHRESAVPQPSGSVDRQGDGQRDRAGHTGLLAASAAPFLLFDPPPVQLPIEKVTEDPLRPDTRGPDTVGGTIELLPESGGIGPRAGGHAQANECGEGPRHGGEAVAGQRSHLDGISALSGNIGFSRNRSPVDAGSHRTQPGPVRPEIVRVVVQQAGGGPRGGGGFPLCCSGVWCRRVGEFELPGGGAGSASGADASHPGLVGQHPQTPGDGGGVDGRGLGESAAVDVDGAGAGGAGHRDEGVEDAFVAGATGAGPVRRVGSDGGLDAVEFVVDRGPRGRGSGGEAGGGVQGAAPLPVGVLAAAGAVLAQPDQSRRGGGGRPGVGEGVSGAGHAQEDAVHEGRAVRSGGRNRGQEGPGGVGEPAPRSVQAGIGGRIDDAHRPGVAAVGVRGGGVRVPGEQPFHHLRRDFGVEAGQGGVEGGPVQVGPGLPAAAVRCPGRADGAGGGVRQGGGVEAGVVLAQGVGEATHVVGGRARGGEAQPEVLPAGGPGLRAQVWNTELRQLRGQPIGIGAGGVGAVAPAVEVERQQAVAMVGAGQVDRPRKSGRLAGHGHRGGVRVSAIRVDPHSGTRRPAARAHVEKATIR